MLASRQTVKDSSKVERGDKRETTKWSIFAGLACVPTPIFDFAHRTGTKTKVNTRHQQGCRNPILSTPPNSRQPPYERQRTRMAAHHVRHDGHMHQALTPFEYVYDDGSRASNVPNHTQQKKTNVTTIHSTWNRLPEPVPFFFIPNQIK